MMRDVIRWLAVTTLLAIIVWGSGCCGSNCDEFTPAATEGPQAGEAGSATVVGYVLSTGQEPVAGTTVLIDDSISASTTDDGSFVLSDVPVGTRTVRVEGGGYKLVGGPAEVEIETGYNDIGNLVVCPESHGAPPSVPES